MNDVRLNTEGIDKLRAMLGNLASSEAQVGIFADKDGRSDGGSNADIGAKHEFGVVEGGYVTPERSFLRMPLMAHGAEKVQARAVLLGAAVNLLDADAVLEQLGQAGESAVQEAFDTGGFGEWPSLSARRVEEKGHDTILIDKGELRASVGSRVAPKGGA